MKKRTLCLLLSLCLLCGLSGCTRVGREEDQSVSTLPPATVSFDAPDGDEVIGEPQYRVLYLPDSNELHLIPRMARTEAGELGDIVESLVEKQIEAENQLQAEKVEMGEA